MSAGAESSNSDILYPSWQPAYRDAWLEMDLSRLKAKIDAAETAIIIRAQEVTMSDSEPEHLAMVDAASALRALMVNTLKYPDGNK